MLDQMFDLFDIKADFDLAIMQANQSLSSIAARVLLGLDSLLVDVQPDWVLVQGDTTTVMAASLAAHHRHIQVAHVEAGLRTYDRQNPFPEEMNRVVADHVADLHLAPTQQAKTNLLREGISPESIFVTGNTVIDALLNVVSRDVPLESLPISLADERPLILVTAHRRENHGRPLQNICAALQQIAEQTDAQIVYPVHRNPNVWNVVHDLLGNIPNVVLCPPLDYLPLVHLMKRSRLILTDSGGIQEEAPTLGVPVLVLRTVTERPEAVAGGVVRLVGTDSQVIVEEVLKLLHDDEAYLRMSKATNPYGDGQASARITSLILNNGQPSSDFVEWGQ
jgi:UDP-N-acetylglucosamine 2-epimerase (non-hydrolysing)